MVERRGGGGGLLLSMFLLLVVKCKCWGQPPTGWRRPSPALCSVLVSSVLWQCEPGPRQSHSPQDLSRHAHKSRALVWRGAVRLVTIWSY